MKPPVYLLLAIIVGASACSLLNREGPDVTCTDLDGGLKNDCSEGITATCVGDEVSWTVCDDESACEASWQTPGQYRCEETDPFPNGTATGTGGGTSGPGGTGAGAPSGSTSTTGGGCDPDGPCEIASNDLPIAAYAVRDGQLYFADRETLRSVPVRGGFPTVLASSLREVGPTIEVDESHVYLHEWLEPDAIVRVPIGGGVAEVVATSPAIRTFCIDPDNVYWAEEYSPGKLVATPKVGGTSTLVAEQLTVGQRMICRGQFVYWLSTQTGDVMRLSSEGPFPATPVSIPLGYAPDDFAVGHDAVFFITQGDVNPGGPGTGVVGKALFEGGVMELVTQQTLSGGIAIDDGAVYWSGTAGSGFLRRVDQNGGSVTEIGTGSGATAIPGRIVVDETHTYWAAGGSMWRAPKGD